MVVFRYLIREILITMAAVTAVLLLVIMGSRFIRYFADAAAGSLPVGLVGSLMLFHMPGFLQLILPLAFFLGIMLAYGQLYLNSEMTVLQACGFSPLKLLGISLWPGVFTGILVGLCSLWLTPLGLATNELTLQQQSAQADFSALSPGRFQDFGSGRTVYAEHLSENRSRLENVFISEGQDATDDSSHVVTRAESGYQVNDEQTGQRYLVLSNGHRYTVEPGGNAAERLDFATYAFRIESVASERDLDDVELQSTAQLLTRDDSDARAELQWRLSLALMIPVLTLLAMSLSRVDPRQGRFAKLLPAIMLHVVYLSLLLSAQEAMRDGVLATYIGVWPIHLVFLLFGLWLLRRTFGQRRGR